MTSLYFDTAYLCKMYWPESGSPEVAKFAARADVLVCGLHGRAEFLSIGHRKVREGVVTSRQLAGLFEQFRADCAVGAIRLLPLTDTTVDLVERIFLQAPASVFLRAAHGLHLACAAEHGFAEIYSNDHHLLAAAPLFGVRGVDVLA
ncbi:MAG: type II toxin-antitoxin system VapC family toxin [Thermoflexales bacterium]